MKNNRGISILGLAYDKVIREVIDSEIDSEIENDSLHYQLTVLRQAILDRDYEDGYKVPDDYEPGRFKLEKYKKGTTQ